jgi:hypothetical protein
MAFISTGWNLVVNLMDSGGEGTSKTYQLSSADATDAAADSATVLAALGGVTDLEVVSYFWYEKFAEDTVSYPIGGIEKENQALLVFDIVNNPSKRATHAIPGAKIDIFVGVSGPNRNIVDTADAAVIAYRSLFQAAGPAYISDGEKAFTLVSGHRRHTKNNRG